MMAQRMAVVVGLLVGMAWWGGVAVAQPCTPAECMTNGMCTQDGECEGTPVSGGNCDDGFACTTDDTCVNGVCMGSPSSGGSCDDSLDCTMNDRCTAGACLGDPAPVGTECQGGCGTCQQTVPVPGVPPQCMPKPGSEGQSCDFGFGDCFTGTCMVFGGLFTACFPQLVQCPETDQDPCTTDFCNPLTGRCENVGSICGECATCDPQTGDCLPGVSPGTPTATRTGAPATPTATPIPATATATVPAATPTATVPRATPTMPGPGPCVADCDGDRVVSVAEVVFATRIALGLASLEDCQAADFDENGRVTVDELVLAVQALLGGCAS